MRQKVSIARALIHDPPVLIFDEATVGLDVLVARSLLQIVGQLRDQGKCIVFSTHIMREVEKLCDRVAIMSHGRMLAEGTLTQLRETHDEQDLEELFLQAAVGARIAGRRVNWTNVKLIASREIRDQLRDRRTIFVIVFLPLLLYPLLGMSFLQVAQFMREHPTKIWMIGTEQLPKEPTLLVGNAFRSNLLATPTDHRLFEIDTKPLPAGTTDVEEVANAAVSAGKFDAVVYLSPDFVEQIKAYATDNDTDEKTDGVEGEDEETESRLGPEVYYNIAKDKSRVAHDRVIAILSRWRDDFSQPDGNKPTAEAKPFKMVRHDLSVDSGRRAAVWSKILPLILIIWAMTGAFLSGDRPVRRRKGNAEL